MNWITFVVLLWLSLGAETGLKDALELGETGMAPSFVIVLVVVVALLAPKKAAIWSAILAGALLDLTRAAPTAAGVGMTPTLGPYALGAAVGVYAVITMRGVVLTRNPLTIFVLSFLAHLLAQLVVIGLFAARSWYDPAVDFAATAALLRGLGSALYTGVIALALGPALLALTPMFAFEPTQTGWSRRRRAR